MRVVFAKICEDKPHLLILDEPTNHLDIYSIDALTEALQTFKGAVLLVTHNCNMLNRFATDLHVIEHGVCHAASCPVGMELGDWMMQRHASMDVKDYIPPAKTNSAAKSVVHASRAISKIIQTTSAKCVEESAAQTAVTQLSTVPTPARDAGPLRATEKEFLRCTRRLREILKLEALKLGQQLDKAQAKKLDKKEEAVEELVSSANYLPADSDLLEKNPDMKELLELQHR